MRSFKVIAAPTRPPTKPPSQAISDSLIPGGLPTSPWPNKPSQPYLLFYTHPVEKEKRVTLPHPSIPFQDFPIWEFVSRAIHVHLM
ncbi:hypothetical protein BU16DRAFT_60001 [Lophium mytilinum]|uniref:Uncharacterized protein n=1 Tax=Lophium mytilinum TaxID=390894 RepID=A0A6A6QP57_9PEZI|nr:hypothetical protein BU16DRAFT_60001 [Lophium mytilinum]